MYSQCDQDEKEGEIGAWGHLKVVIVDGGVADDATDEEGEEVVEEGAHEVAGEGELDDDVGTVVVGGIAELHVLDQELVHRGRPAVGQVAQYWSVQIVILTMLLSSIVSNWR